jgi:Fic family protein
MLLPFDQARCDPWTREIDRLRSSLDAYPLVHGWSDRLASDLMAEAIQASTNMEGVPVTVEEVRRILAGDRPSGVSAEDASLVTGYRDAMTYCQRRADDDVFSWSPELIKAIHDRVLAGRPDWGAGRYGKGRHVQNSATGALIYTPPQEGVHAVMEALCARMNTWDGHAAVKSAWVHIALAAIHPFKDGNGRTARVLASLAMYRGGFKRREFISLEEWWGRFRNDYAAAFNCLGTAFDASTDVTPFIEAHLSAQVQQLHVLQDVERVRRRIWDGIEALLSKFALPDRANVALWEAFWGRVITRPYYLSVTQVGERTATADLGTMVTSRLLREEGRTRGKHWITGEDFFVHLGAQYGLSGEASNKQSIIALVSEQVVREAASLRNAHAPTQTTLFEGTESTESGQVVQVSGGTRTT